MHFSIAVMAMGFKVCEITKDGVEPHKLAGVEKKIREYMRQGGPRTPS
jgi:hypothetical protein